MTSLCLYTCTQLCLVNGQWLCRWWPEEYGPKCQCFSSSMLHYSFCIMSGSVERNITKVRWQIIYMFNTWGLLPILVFASYTIKFHCNRLTTVQDYTSLIFWHTLYCESKICQSSLSHNFCKCRLILTILSLLDSATSLQQDSCYIFHCTKACRYITLQNFCCKHIQISSSYWWCLRLCLRQD